MPRLTKEEREILRSYEKGDWRSLRNSSQEAARYQKYARSMLQKDSRVNIRISTKDMESVQKKALEEGIPYQTLMASVIHKYVSGTLVDAARLGIHGGVNL